MKIVHLGFRKKTSFHCALFRKEMRYSFDFFFSKSDTERYPERALPRARFYSPPQERLFTKMNAPLLGKKTMGGNIGALSSFAKGSLKRKRGKRVVIGKRADEGKSRITCSKKEEKEAQKQHLVEIVVNHEPCEVYFDDGLWHECLITFCDPFDEMMTGDLWYSSTNEVERGVKLMDLVRKGHIYALDYDGEIPTDSIDESASEKAKKGRMSILADAVALHPLEEEKKEKEEEIIETDVDEEKLHRERYINKYNALVRETRVYVEKLKHRYEQKVMQMCEEKDRLQLDLNLKHQENEKLKNILLAVRRKIQRSSSNNDNTKRVTFEQPEQKVKEKKELAAKKELEQALEANSDKDEEAGFKVVVLTKDGKTTDGHKWRKYGEKLVTESKYPRSYYRCVSIPNAGIKKHVEQIDKDRALVTSYSHSLKFAKALCKAVPGSALIPRVPQEEQEGGEEEEPALATPTATEDGHRGEEGKEDKGDEKGDFQIDKLVADCPEKQREWAKRHFASRVWKQNTDEKERAL